MKEYKVPRTGNVPLTFHGEEMAVSSGKWHAGEEQNRWHDITVYRTAGGKLVLHVAYRTQWQGEDGRDTVSVHDDMGAAIDALRDYDPLEHLAGYPPHPHYAEKQARLKDSLRRRWAAQVSDVLEALGVEDRID